MFSEFNDKLIKLINDGGVGIIPTDTVYGLVCRADNVAAVQRLYSLKPRKQKRGTVVAHNVEQLIKLGIKRTYLRVAEQFWPASISVILPHNIDYLSQSLGTQAFRIPEDKTLQDLLRQTGPLLTTSANPPEEPTANTIKEAMAYFKDKLDYYVDGGDLSGRLASTIVQVIDDAVDIVRQGEAKIDPRLLS